MPRVIEQLQHWIDILLTGSLTPHRGTLTGLEASVCVDDMFNLALFSQVFPRTISQLWVDVCLFVVHFGQLS